jgi:hypothetical protein
MGCCNKKPTDRPVGRLRFLAGLVFFLAAEGGVLLFLALGSLVSTRCRRVLPFYRAFATDRVRSVWRREGFSVGTAPACAPDEAR